MNRITSIDTAWGVTILVSNPDDENDKALAVFKNSHIYGETEAEDCPDDHGCWCYSKTGFMGLSSRMGDKDFMIDKTSPLPMINAHSYGTWAGDT